MPTDERMGRLTGIVEPLAASVVAYGNQIEALIKISAESAQNWKNLERQSQAYLNTLPRQ